MIYMAHVFVIFILLYLFAVLPRLSQRGRMRPFLNTQFAHRGYHCKELGVPENSMAAFRAAIAHDYGIELDIHLSKDGQLVVFHDDTLSRMCGRPEQVEELTFQELTTCRLLDTDETIPSFDQVLKLVNGQVPLLIELKIPSSSLTICWKTARRLKAYSGAYLVQSFNTMGLRWFKLHEPKMLRGQLSSNLTADETKESWILKFMLKNLLTNFLGRPDFISYKLKDLPRFGVWLNKHIFRTPVAVWTLRTESALAEGVRRYDIQIFEKSEEIY